MLNLKVRVEEENRRRSERLRMRGLARIHVPPRTVRDCWITDISDGGARIHCEAPDVPETFTLSMPGKDQRRECRVAWRLGPEFGVEFTDRHIPGFARQVASGSR